MAFRQISSLLASLLQQEITSMHLQICPDAAPSCGPGSRTSLVAVADDRKNEW